MRMESFLIYVTPPHLYVTFIEVGLWLEILFCVPQTLIFFFFLKNRSLIIKLSRGNIFLL